MQVEQEIGKKSCLQSELSLLMSDCAQQKTKIEQINNELLNLRQHKKITEEELQKLKTQQSVDDLQLKELQEQLEAEQYFSVIFFFFFVNYIDQNIKKKETYNFLKYVLRIIYLFFIF